MNEPTAETNIVRPPERTLSPRYELLRREKEAQMTQDYGTLTQDEFIKKYIGEIVEKQIRIDEGEQDELIEGFYKRRRFFDHVEQVINELPRLEKLPHFKGAVFFFLDFDDFKVANETYDHEFGDDVLKLVGSVMRKNMRRKSDFFGHIGPDERDQPEVEEADTSKQEGVVGRYGGDELMGLLFDTNPEDAKLLLEKTQREITETFSAQSDLRLRYWGQTITIGLTQIKEGDTPIEVKNRGDAAVARAKRQGKNQVAVA